MEVDQSALNGAPLGMLSANKPGDHTGSLPAERNEMEAVPNIDALIAEMEGYKHKLCLIRSEVKVKKAAAEEEQSFIKAVWVTCGRNCAYYLKTSLHFGETQEQFQILFHIFQEGLLKVTSQVSQMEQLELALDGMMSNENQRLREETARCETLKTRLQETNEAVASTQNESTNIEQQIWSYDREMTELLEAHESFRDVTKSDISRKEGMDQLLGQLKEDESGIKKEILSISTRLERSEDDLINEQQLSESDQQQLKTQIQTLRNALEESQLRRNKLNADTEILLTQQQLIETQIASKEHFMNSASLSLQTTLSRKSELAEKIEHAKQELKRLSEALRGMSVWRAQTEQSIASINESIKASETEIKEREQQLEKITEEESELGICIDREKSKMGTHILSILSEDRDRLEEKIEHYKKQTNKLLNEEKSRGVLFRDDSIELSDYHLVTKHLEIDTDNIQNLIQEKHERRWNDEREARLTQRKIQGVQLDLTATADANVMLDQSLKLIHTALESMRKEKAKIKQELQGMKQAREQRAKECQGKEAALSELKKSLSDLETEAVKNKQNLESEYKQKEAEICRSSQSEMGKQTNEEKVKGETELLCFQLNEEYRIKKEHYQKELENTYKEEEQKVQKQLSDKEKLLNYYKELISNMANKNKGNEKTKKKKGKKREHKEAASNNRNESMNSYYNNAMERSSLIKLLRSNDLHNFNYFELTSPNIIKNKANKTDQWSRSPRVNKYLENYGNRKEASGTIPNPTSANSTVATSDTVKSGNKNLKSKKSKFETVNIKQNQLVSSANFPTYDLFKHLQ